MVQFWEGVDTPVGGQTTGLWFRQYRKLWLPQVQCSDKVGRPCDYAATGRLATGGASDSVLAGICGHSSCRRDEFAFSVDGGFKGVFSRIFRIFRAPPDCPGVERQFSSPR